MYRADVVKLMIASPSDVTRERDTIRSVVHEWNSVHSEDKNIILMPVGWDTHAEPEMGDRPQELLNKRILSGCDCLVAVFWTRIGSPTGRSISGTVEEVEGHISAGGPAMIYFSRAPVRPDSVDDVQYKGLLEFRQKCESRGLIETYDTVQEFREKFARQLAQMVIREFGGGTDDEAPDVAELQVRRSRDQVVESLSEDARKLLVEGSLDDGGMIMTFRSMGGLMIQANDKGFTEQGNPRSEARWGAALKQLDELELVQDLNYKGEMFQLTDLGYQVADELRGVAARPRQQMTTQRRAWVEMNQGEDARGSRPDDDEARAVIERHDGIRTSSGDYRFPDGSMLMARQARIVASPDPDEGGVRPIGPSSHK